MKQTIFVLLVAVMATTACKKNSTVSANCTVATVQYGGDPALDGLGWTIFIGDSATGHIEIAENLPESFKTNGLLVDLCYERTDHLYYCFCAQPFKMIHIISIKKH